METLFMEALKEENTEKLLQVPKGDLHNHSTKGCRRAWLEEKLNRRFPAPPEKFSGLIGMQEWFRATIKPFSNNTEGMVMRWEGAFAEAKRNNIQRLSMNFGAPEIDEMRGMEAFTTVIQGFHRAYCPETVFEPEITYVSCCDAAEAAEKMDVYLSSGFFKSIDVCGGEDVQPVEAFLPLYRKAEQYHLVKRMHVGESGGADDV